MTLTWLWNRIPRRDCALLAKSSGTGWQRLSVQWTAAGPFVKYSGEWHKLLGSGTVSPESRNTFTVWEAVTLRLRDWSEAVRALDMSLEAEKPKPAAVGVTIVTTSANHLAASAGVSAPPPLSKAEIELRRILETEYGPQSVTRWLRDRVEK